MKAFYAVAIGMLLLLIAARGPQRSHAIKPYFNGPVKKVQQRIYGLDDNRVSDHFVQSPLPLAYPPLEISSPPFQVERLLLEAFDMEFAQDGTRLSHTRYEGAGSELQLQVKKVWDSLGEYHQISRKIHRDYSVTYDSVARTYNPETHIITQHHWQKKEAGTWEPLPASEDSILQIGDFAVLYFRRQVIISQTSTKEPTDGSKQQLILAQNRTADPLTDSIAFKYKDNQLIRFRQCNTERAYQVEFDSSGRVTSIRNTFDSEQKHTVVSTIYDYDGLAPSYFIERLHKSEKGAKWETEHTKSHYFFDVLGRLSRWESITFEADTPSLVYTNRFIYAADSSSIRREFYKDGELLERYEQFSFDSFGNSIGYQNQILSPDGSKTDSTLVKLDSLVYDQYGNWIKAIYIRGQSPMLRLERQFSYYR